MSRRTVVIGAGPAGLTAALELGRLGRPAVVLERDDVVGGLSRTVNCDGYRFDIGGHRFFTKLQPVRELWWDLLGDELLERPRMSRIHYRGRFFDYPLRPVDALTKLGPFEAGRIVLSYVKTRLTPPRADKSFEDWVVNRFGRRLFEVFFESYTEKVWGLPCGEISADWAEQRIKNLDLGTAVKTALLGRGSNRGDVAPSLIDRFHYPTRGPGMMWERCRDRAADLGVDTVTGARVVRVRHRSGRIESVEYDHDGQVHPVATDAVISSMPLPDLIRVLDPAPPGDVIGAAERLRFRDFLTVVLMVDRADVFPDNWIYIHSSDVKVGRVQNYKNWSPFMVPDPSVTALGLEYFVQEGDELWESRDEELRDLAIRELGALGLIDGADVSGHAVFRAPRAYPVYDSQYREAVDTIRAFLDGIGGLYCVGRNGQHRYNNQDHSMLTGLLAANNVAGARHDVWTANPDTSYLEEMGDDDTADSHPGRPSAEVEPRLAAELSDVFARYDPIALGGAVGLVSGLALFAATAALLIQGGDPVGPTLSLLGNYLVGFEVSWPGAVLGWLEASLGGFVFGYFLARLINRVVDLVAESVVHECLLRGLLDPPGGSGPAP